MASNRFGSLFTFTTWGESHGKAVGVVIDGCPAGIALDEEGINKDLERRAPGRSSHVSPRSEKDQARIISGVFEGKTTGSPVSLIIENGGADSSKYAPIADLLRPGHANYTYLEKYGIFDWRGGGRASARETAGRVAAGAVARRFLKHYGISASACLSAVGKADFSAAPLDRGMTHARTSALFAPDSEAEAGFAAELEQAAGAGDSVGGVVSFTIRGLPAGLGDPVYGRLDALLAFAMLSIPGSKGFEAGQGFAAAAMRGSAFTDGFTAVAGRPVPSGNLAGGTLGGISTGLPVYGRVAFKPTASFFQPLNTVDRQGNKAEFLLPEGSRHDPCVAVRAVPVVEAMCLLVLADVLLMNRASRM